MYNVHDFDLGLDLKFDDSGGIYFLTNFYLQWS